MATTSSDKSTSSSDSSKNSSTDTSTSTTTTTTKAALTVLPGILTIIYAIECALCILIAGHLLCYSYRIPKDFAKLGRIMKIDGCIFKLLVKLCRLIHYIVLFMIIGEGAEVGTGSCKNALHVKSGVVGEIH